MRVKCNVKHFVTQDGRRPACRTHEQDPLRRSIIMLHMWIGQTPQQTIVSVISNVCTVEPHKKDQAWAAVMESLPVLGKSEDSSRALTKLLTSLFVTYFVPVPADLKDTVSAGLSCTCTPARHMLPGTQSVPETQVI